MQEKRQIILETEFLSQRLSPDTQKKAEVPYVHGMVLQEGQGVGGFEREEQTLPPVEAEQQTDTGKS